LVLNKLCTCFEISSAPLLNLNVTSVSPTSIGKKFVLSKKQIDNKITNKEICIVEVEPYCKSNSSIQCKKLNNDDTTMTALFSGLKAYCMYSFVGYYDYDIAADSQLRLLETSKTTVRTRPDGKDIWKQLIKLYNNKLV